ncbi:MAG: hypothetical protein HOM55_06195 [Proteobacteria bacterium]|jgi:hypothetical protein|nr:hypothetical protein [Pseudomonadota bacterium]
MLYQKAWRVSYMLMLAGLAIDLDHLLANPIYDPNRCSIGFHPLHAEFPIALYCLALWHPKTRVVGIGLLVHIILDSIDCRVSSGVWYVG